MKTKGLGFFLATALLLSARVESLEQVQPSQSGAEKTNSGDRCSYCKAIMDTKGKQGAESTMTVPLRIKETCARFGPEENEQCLETAAEYYDVFQFGLKNRGDSTSDFCYAFSMCKTEIAESNAFLFKTACRACQRYVRYSVRLLMSTTTLEEFNQRVVQMCSFISVFGNPLDCVLDMTRREITVATASAAARPTPKKICRLYGSCRFFVDDVEDISWVEVPGWSTKKGFPELKLPAGFEIPELSLPDFTGINITLPGGEHITAPLADSPLAKEIQAVTEGTLGTLNETAGALLEGATEAMSTLTNATALSEATENATTALIEGATEAMSTLTNATALAEASQNATTAIMEGTSEVIGGLTNTTGEIIEGIGSTLGSLTESITQPFASIFPPPSPQPYSAEVNAHSGKNSLPTGETLGIAPGMGTKD